MDDFLGKLVALKAAAFVDAKTKTGIETPEIVVSASYDSGKFERVRIGKVGQDAFGARDGEAGAGKIETIAMAGVLQALDTAVMPPPPPPPPPPAPSPAQPPAASTDKAGAKK